MEAGEQEDKDKGTGPQEFYDHCLRCGRGLSNPVSMRRGYGPICASKLMRQMRLEEAIRAQEEEEA